MPGLIHEDNVQVTLVNKPAAGVALQMPAAGSGGLRTPGEAGYANGDLMPCIASNQSSGGSDWVFFIGTYVTGTPNTVTKFAILSSSNASADVDFSAGGDVVLSVQIPAAFGQYWTTLQKTFNPGGRLTPVSGDPIGASANTTSLWYTPYIHDVIGLWNGAMWVPTEFVETQLALGTLTAGIGYDVFAYLNNGAFALEKLAWTSATVRATPVTLQDGRYCKSGDKTRLLIGSFYATSTTQTQITSTMIGVSNVYNKVKRGISKNIGSSNHSYASSTSRLYNNGSTNLVSAMISIAASWTARAAATISNTGGLIIVGRNGASYVEERAQAAGAYTTARAQDEFTSVPGLITIEIRERTDGATADFDWGLLGVMIEW